MCNKSKREVSWKRALRSLSAMTGLFAAVGAGTSVAVAQDAGYRSAAAAPASWQAFAKQLQGCFEQRLTADDKEARSFRGYIAKREAGANTPPLTFVVRTWVLPNGMVERIEFDGLDDADAAVNLRALLARGDVGPPPPDLLQPLHLRLSLRPKDPSHDER